MSDIFQVVTGKDIGANWLICWTGADELGNDYNVETNHIRGSALYQYTGGAERDAALIARLLNWYYADKDLAERTIGYE